MGTVGSPEEICNMSLSMQGKRGSIENIETPEKPEEKTYAKWYNSLRKLALKTLKPNFALERRIVAEDATAVIFDNFGYPYAYEYPSDCLQLLGVGDVKDKFNDYSVEGGVIYHDVDYTEDGLPIRFIGDVDDVTRFTSDFIVAFASLMAEKTAMEIVEDLATKQALKEESQFEKATSSGLSAQENRPIRKNDSKMKASRRVNYPVGSVKR